MPLDLADDRPVFSPNNQLLSVAIMSAGGKISELFPQQPPIKSISQLPAAEGFSQDYAIDDGLLCEKKVTIHRVAIQEEVIQIFKYESTLNYHIHILALLGKKRSEKARGFF